MYLLKNAEIYAPEYLGKKDILIAGEHIELIDDEIDINNSCIEIIDCTGKIVAPGLCDQHIHITGGGGEGGFKTRAPEINLSELIASGITTVVGLLGTDSATRSVENLVAKAKALNDEGLTVYACTGAYNYPTPTLTDSIEKDIVFINEIIGTKIALSDHRSSNPSQDEFNYVASQTRKAGMISDKAGIVIVHMGDDEKGMKPIFDMLEQTSVPVKTVRPTHVSRNEHLLADGFKYAKLGGMIDLTCGEEGELRASRVIKRAEKENIPFENITISTDANGSWSNYDKNGNLIEMGVSSPRALLKELQYMVNVEGIDLSKALTFITSNVSKGLKLYPRKGHICQGADADLIILDKDITLSSVLARGRVMMSNKEVLVYGTYEKH